MKARRVEGGAPNFRSAAALQAKVDEYFEACAGRVMEDPATGGPMLDRQGRPVRVDDRPPTLSGLALALGFSSKAGLTGYRGKKQYEEVLLRARSRLEQYAEEQLFSRSGSAGARFMLEHGFKDETPENDGEALASGYDKIMAEVRARIEGAQDGY